jgi:hypothetical protein
MNAAVTSLGSHAFELCRGAALYVATICALRALPFVAHVVADKAERWWSKALALLAYAALVAFALGIGCDGATLLACFLASIYYLCCACAIPFCARALRAQHISAGALFVLLAFGLLLLPSALAPGFAFSGLVIGWELLLSSYSYCREAARNGTDAPLRDCLFFLLVDPTVVYSARSVPARAPSDYTGLRRVALGVMTMFVAYAALRPAYQALRPLHGAPTGAVVAGLGALLFAVLRFFAEYAAHAGLTDIQIGLMRQRGYATPERYVKPFLATSPADFWRRWNRYLALWLKQYVFSPTVRWLREVRLPLPRLVTAVFTTVLASGLLHDGYAYAADHVPRTRSVQFFAANGCAIATWALARRARIIARIGATDAVGRVASRVLFAFAMLAACFVWG